VALLPIPVDRLLVPPAPADLPNGFVRVRQSLERGLPATFRLDPELSLALYAPTGDALLWRDARGDESVTAAADDDEPVFAGATGEVVARAPLRLVLLRAGAIVGAMPLVPGPPRRVPDHGVALVELAVLNFRVHAGNLRQAGDYGSFVDVAWRRIDRSADRFALPPIDPRVASRFAGQIQSQVGETAGEEHS
jgi:hypothetical protein